MAERNRIPTSSLAAFWDDVFRPLLAAVQPKRILEIGADTGSMTLKLLDYAEEHGIVVESIDPAPSFDVDEVKARFQDHLIFHFALSLDVLRTIELPDLVLIDGDHNWYTVLHELTLLEHRAVTANTLPPVIALHDIDWPYGRRDLYYNPENLPEAALRPYAYKGLAPERDELVDGGLNQRLANAELPADSHSGIRGAIEDFLAHSDNPWQFHEIHGQSGLGILVCGNDEPSDPLREFLAGIRSVEFLRRRVQTIERARLDTEVHLAQVEHKAAKWIKKVETAARARESDLQSRLDEVTRLNVDLSKRLIEVNTEIARVKAESERNAVRTASLEQIITEYEQSTSWRLTAWLRALGKLRR